MGCMTDEKGKFALAAEPALREPLDQYSIPAVGRVGSSEGQAECTY